MESITLSGELVLPGWDCPGSSAERDGLIDQRRRRLRERYWQREKKRARVWLFRGKGRRAACGCVRGGVSDWLDFPCVSVIIGEPVWIHQPARSSAAAPNATPAYITWLFAGRRCGLMVSHIGHHCLFEGNERTEGKGNFLFGLLFLPPSYKYGAEMCYIVFIHAENLLLGLCFVDDCFFCLSSLLLPCSFYCLINFESVCVLLVCQQFFFKSFVGFVLFIACLVPPWTIWLYRKSVW